MYKSPHFHARNKNRAQELSENIRVTNSKCMLTPTNLKITDASHVLTARGMHASQEYRTV